MRLDAARRMQRIRLAVERLVSRAGLLLPDALGADACGHLHLGRQLRQIIEPDVAIPVHASGAVAFQLEPIVEDQILGLADTDHIRPQPVLRRLAVVPRRVDRRARRAEDLRIRIRAALDRQDVQAPPLRRAHVLVNRVRRRAVRRVDRCRPDPQQAACFMPVRVGDQRRERAPYAARQRVFALVHHVAEDLVPYDQPAFLATPPRAQHDREAIMLNVDAER
ncbi:Uncharacterised protein [Burkholderia pseudomallei]|nr:Uncharacterised protein [Burkholderia pseudomallei]